MAGVVAGLVSLPATANAAVTTVTCNGTALQTAITNANPGDILVLAPGCHYSYSTPFDATDDALPPIAKTLTIVGNGATIERSAMAAANFRIFEIDLPGDLRISNVTVRNGQANGDGGGFLVLGGRLTTGSTTITANMATNVGGGISVEPFGGVGGSATLNATTLSGNTAVSNGGGLELVGGVVGTSATLNNSTVTDNSSGALGGGIRVAIGSALTLNSTRVIRGTTLTGNIALQGGGISVVGSATLNSSTVSGNTASGAGAAGGGILNDGTLKLNSSTVTNNTANGTNARGGGIANSGTGTATLRSSPVSGNQALGMGADGGGVFNNGGTVTLISSPVTGNTPNNCGMPSTVPGCV
ncbi:hypothetical protein GTS_50460 [Gandjariella thermophila]|uniref:Right handed beta helix domain-containing protein n=1 Tax=Gandjariella thermophila TaxID=1931992 RepID=A0A4D4JHN6_9PSEU|nr:hypothetical protein GTS_50460 [Gandjariella thermophila]